MKICAGSHAAFAFQLSINFRVLCTADHAFMYAMKVSNPALNICFRSASKPNGVALIIVSISKLASSPGKKRIGLR
jgi:hypothetical protein